MKKNRFFWASAAIAALTLTACADQDEFNQNDVQTAAVENAPGAIQFGTYLGKTGTTRAWVKSDASPSTGQYNGGVITTNGSSSTKSLKNAEFGVFAYQTGADDWSATHNAAEFMYNQQIKWNTSSPTAWIYNPVKYWPNGIDAANADNDPSNTATQGSVQKLSFFAYAPYTANTTTQYTSAAYGDYPGTSALTNTDVFQTTAYAGGAENKPEGVIGMTDWDATGDPWLNYYLHNALTTKAVDLLWGLRGQYTYDETDNVDNTQLEKLGNTYNVNLTKQSVKEKVRFLFKHALAKFGGSTKNATSDDEAATPAQTGIKVVVDVDANNTNPGAGLDKQSDYFGSNFDNTKTLVTLKEVKIRDSYSYSNESGVVPNIFAEKQESNINTYGWFNISTGEWQNAGHPTGTAGTGDGTKVSLTINSTGIGDGVAKLHPAIMDIDVNATGEIDASKKSLATGGATWATGNPSGVTASPQSVYANGDNAGIMLIPGNAPQTLYVTVDYFVRTADTQLKKGWSQVEQIITNRVDLVNLEPNKYYTLVIHLGLTSVKFEAVVADWTLNSGDTFDEDGITNEDPSSEEDKAIWLPSNVVNTTTITADANTSHKAVTVAADQTSYTIHLTGLTTGNTLSETHTSAPGVTNVALAPATITAAGTATATVTLKPNNTNLPVVNTIVIKEGSTVSTTTVTITQAAGVLTLTRSDVEVPEAGKAITITAKNGTADVALVASDVTITPTATATISGSGSNVIEYTIPVNTTPYKKPYTFTVTNTNAESTNPMSATTTIVQAAGTQTATISGTANVASGNGTASIVYNANATSDTPAYAVTVNSAAQTMSEYTYSTAATWLTVNETTGALTFTENPAKIERTATIILTHKDGAKVTVTVKQKGV